MNSLGLNIIMRMGCLCTKEKVDINGKCYTVRDRLGAGVVDLVEDDQTHELLAMKRIECHSNEDQKVAMAEIEYNKCVDHPGIIRFVDYDLRTRSDPLHDSSTEVVILLPYYQRGTLADELSKRQSNLNHFKEKEILRIFRQICTAVKAFHDAKPVPLVHRDLKTANILLDDSFSPVIMDLGSVAPSRITVRNVSEAKRLEETAAERCSMPYRAPELFNISSGTSFDERTDIWSLGCIFFALCFFKSPFDIVYERGDSVSLAAVSGKIKIPSNSPYSQSLHDFIIKMLNVDPKERPFINEVIATTEKLAAECDGCV